MGRWNMTEEDLCELIKQGPISPCNDGKLFLIFPPHLISAAHEVFGESAHIVASPMLGDEKVAHNPHDAFLHVKNKRTKRKKL